MWIAENQKSNLAAKTPGGAPGGLNRVQNGYYGLIVHSLQIGCKSLAKIFRRLPWLAPWDQLIEKSCKLGGHSS